MFSAKLSSKTPSLLTARSQLEDCRGASLIELAIILPLALLMIGGFVDFGLKLSTVKTIAAAARHAGRIASAHTKNVAFPPPCGPLVDEVCSPEPNPLPISSSSVSEVARDAACNYLRSAKLDPTDWKVSVAPPYYSEEGGAKFNMTAVTVSRATQDCILCYDKVFQALKAESSSSIVLEGGCLK